VATGSGCGEVSILSGFRREYLAIRLTLLEYNVDDLPVRTFQRLLCVCAHPGLRGGCADHDLLRCAAVLL